jgi:hypothetical protein
MTDSTNVTLPMTGTLLTAEQVAKITQAAQQEFPYDPVFQQIHFARKVLRLEAEQLKMDYFSYLKQLGDQQIQQRHLKVAEKLSIRIE